jgi:hypothetical protein
MADVDPPSWLADPTGRHEHRYWDGTAWTEHVADDGEAATDPYDGDGPASGGSSASEAGAPSAWTASAPPPAPPDAKLTWDPGTARQRPEADEAPARPFPGGWASPDDILDALAPEPPAPVPDATPTPAAAPPPVSEPIVSASPAAPAPPVERPPLGAPIAAAPAPPPPPDDIPTPHARRRVVVLVIALVVVTAAVAGVVALTGGSDEADGVSDVRAVLEEQLGNVADEDIDCLAEAVVEELGDDGVAALELDERGEDEAGLSPELIAALQVATSTCTVSFAPDDDGSTPTTPTTEIPSLSDLAGQYQARFPALTAPQAECLAQADIALRESEETYAPDEVYARIGACGVEPSVLGIATTSTTPG